MRKKADLLNQRQWLLATLKHLRKIKRMQPNWGRLYARTLARLVLVEMKMEEIEKQKG